MKVKRAFLSLIRLTPSPISTRSLTIVIQD